jgi:hypothetical protein
MTDDPPPYSGINPNYTPSVPPYASQPNGYGIPQQQPMGYAGPQQPPVMGFAGPQQPPAMGSAGVPGASYPTLPQQHNAFEPSAPTAMTKEQEAASSAYYDPRAPNAAFVQQQQFYENPPPYSELDKNNKKQQ